MKEGLLLSTGDLLNYQLILPFHKKQLANEKVKKKTKTKNLSSLGMKEMQNKTTHYIKHSQNLEV